MSNYRIYDAVFPGIAFSHLSDGERYRSERYVIKGLPQRVQNFAKAFFFESNGTIEDAARLLNISVAYAERKEIAISRHALWFIVRSWSF